MSGMLWLRVDGCPRGCHDAADRLDALAGRVEAAAGTLAEDAVLSTTHFDGLAADAFRSRAADVADPARRSVARTRGLATALRELGRDLADVQLVMDRLRAQAAPHLRVLPDRILAPESPRAFQQEERAWAAWDLIAPVHADARRIEQRAQADWSAAVARFTHDGLAPVLGGVLELPVAYEPEVGPHLPRRTA